MKIKKSEWEMRMRMRNEKREWEWDWEWKVMNNIKCKRSIFTLIS